MKEADKSRRRAERVAPTPFERARAAIPTEDEWEALRRDAIDSAIENYMAEGERFQMCSRCGNFSALSASTCVECRRPFTAPPAESTRTFGPTDANHKTRREKQLLEQLSLPYGQRVKRYPGGAGL